MFDRRFFLRTLLVLGLGGVVASCGDRPRVLNLPFGDSGISVNSPYGEQDPAVAGRYVVYTSDRQGSQAIYLFDLVDQRPIPLPGLNRFDTLAADPAVSEDGRYIVFVGIRDGRSQIYLYDRIAQRTRSLTSNLPGQVQHPSISADGSTVAFGVNVGGQWDIAVYDRNGRPLPIATNPR